VVSRWSLPLALAVLLAVPASAADQTVTASPGIAWSPDDVTIDMGDKVTWNNAGGVHNVEFEDGSYTQPPQPSSDQWTVERTFDTAGVFRYQCGFHGASMAGAVRVRDATGQVPEPVDVPPGLTATTGDELGLGRLENRGVRVRTRCVNGCDVALRLSLAPRTAARFGFARQRKTIGTETDTLPANQRVRIAVELTQRAKNRLAGAERSFKVRLDVAARKDTRETARETIKINP
jgi:plastocyanin